MTRRLDQEVDEIRQLRGRLSSKAIKGFTMAFGVIGFVGFMYKFLQNLGQAVKEHNNTGTVDDK